MQFPHYTCSTLPPRGGVSLPTALMLPRCVLSPAHGTRAVACRPWALGLLPEKTTNVAQASTSHPFFPCCSRPVTRNPLACTSRLTESAASSVEGGSRSPR